MKKIQIGPPENTIPLKIRIFRCSQNHYWYSNISLYKNKQYNVLAYWEGKGYLIKRFKIRGRYFIDINDADVVRYSDKTDSSIVIENKDGENLNGIENNVKYSDEDENNSSENINKNVNSENNKDG